MVHLSWITIVILVYSMIAPDVAAQDADRGARRGVDGSAGALDRVPGWSAVASLPHAVVLVAARTTRAR